MTLTLELPKELESDLVNEAEQLGISLPDYTLRLLFTRPTLKAAPKNGAELVAYWQSAGVIGMRSDIDDSQQHARDQDARRTTTTWGGLMYLLDTDVLIDIQRGKPAAVTWFSLLPELPAVPGFVVMELIQDAQNAGQVRQVLRLTAPLPVVWPTEADCNQALTNFTTYHLSHSLGLLDALIAACAVGLSATLCTFNVKHYRVIPGLQTTQPYKR